MRDLLLGSGNAFLCVADAPKQVAEFARQTRLGALEGENLRFPDQLLVQQAFLSLSSSLEKRQPCLGWSALCLITADAFLKTSNFLLQDLFLIARLRSPRRQFGPLALERWIRTTGSLASR